MDLAVEEECDRLMDTPTNSHRALFRRNGTASTLVSLPAPLAWKKQVFPDSTLPSPEGLVKLIRFTMGPATRDAVASARPAWSGHKVYLSK